MSNVNHGSTSTAHQEPANDNGGDSTTARTGSSCPMAPSPASQTPTISGNGGDSTYRSDSRAQLDYPGADSAANPGGQSNEEQETDCSNDCPGSESMPSATNHAAECGESDLAREPSRAAHVRPESPLDDDYTADIVPEDDSIQTESDGGTLLEVIDGDDSSPTATANGRETDEALDDGVEGGFDLAHELSQIIHDHEHLLSSNKRPRLGQTEGTDLGDNSARSRGVASSPALSSQMLPTSGDPVTDDFDLSGELAQIIEAGLPADCYDNSADCVEDDGDAAMGMRDRGTRDGGHVDAVTVGHEACPEDFNPSQELARVSVGLPDHAHTTAVTNDGGTAVRGAAKRRRLTPTALARLGKRARTLADPFTVPPLPVIDEGVVEQLSTILPPPPPPPVRNTHIAATATTATIT